MEVLHLGSKPGEDWEGSYFIRRPTPGSDAVPLPQNSQTLFSQTAVVSYFTCLPQIRGTEEQPELQK